MKKTNKIVLAIIGVIVILCCSFFIYVNNFYKADDTAREILNHENIETIDNFTILKGTSDTGIIFYPGAKVEAISYLPILQKLQEIGLTCVLVDMPFNMAIFNVDGAKDVFDLEAVSDIEKWYISGHSMGGGMASAFASDNEHLFEGLILMGAYVYGDYPTEKSLTIYGTHNSNLEEKIDYTDNIVIIDGGNHAQFGNYGKQKGDPDADISAEEQQVITVSAITEFIFSD